MASAGFARAGLVALAAAFAAPALAHDDLLLGDALTLAALPPAFEISIAAERAESPVNLLIAAHRTGGAALQRQLSHLRQAAAAPGRDLDAPAPAGRREFHQPHPMARAADRDDPRRRAGRSLRWSSTGDEFLRALVEASRRGPIGNLVVYGHAAPNALFMREDRGFYGSVEDVARETRSSRAPRRIVPRSSAPWARATLPT